MLEAYRSKGGIETNSTCFINRIKEYMTDEILFFKAVGFATIFMHKKKASQVPKLVNSKDEDHSKLRKFAKNIKPEIKEVPGVKKEYPVLDEETLQNTIILTLNEILVSKFTKISNKSIGSCADQQHFNFHDQFKSINASNFT